MGLKLILTGATGYVGEGVLLACLQHPDVEKVLMVNRRRFDLEHPKLQELLVPDFLGIREFSPRLAGYDACFFCAGISSIGMNEEKYTRITYDTTMAFAQAVSAASPGSVFHYVSGAHTDSTEKGGSMWARVKGRTENALGRLPFKAEYNFRPGAMMPVKGQKNPRPALVFVVRVIAFFSPRSVLTLEEVAQAMINATAKGYPKRILEIKDIRDCASA